MCEFPSWIKVGLLGYFTPDGRSSFDRKEKP
jgi:hypothetical protein